MILGVEMFAAPPVALPDGPKAVVLVGDAAELPSFQSQSSAAALASSVGIPIFAVRYGNAGSFPRNIAMFSAMAADTGGVYLEAPTGADAAEALATVASLLNDGYRLTIPQTAVTDCNPHMLEVTVQGQTQSAAFNRCDTTPEPFEFETADNVPAGSVVVSNCRSDYGHRRTGRCHGHWRRIFGRLQWNVHFDAGHRPTGRRGLRSPHGIRWSGCNRRDAPDRRRSRCVFHLDRSEFTATATAACQRRRRRFDARRGTPDAALDCCLQCATAAPAEDDESIPVCNSVWRPDGLGADDFRKVGVFVSRVQASVAVGVDFR